jgi:hypothetical protein
MKTYTIEWMYSSTILDLGTSWHYLAALLPGKEPAEPTE